MNDNPRQYARSLTELANYEVQSLIGLGGTSSVFSAIKRIGPSDKPWRVALKFVWDIRLARQEAENLASLSFIRGVVTILDYLECRVADVLPHVDRFEADINSTLVEEKHRLSQELDLNRSVGIIVMQYLVGEPLVKQTSVGEDLQPKGHDYFIVKDLESQVYLEQTLCTPMTLATRLDICLQLVTYIRDCHRQGIVHGDINPQNILFDDKSGQITILDFGGSTQITRGSPGWQAPEHIAFVLGEISALPPEVDIFLIGLVLNRFVQPLKVAGVAELSEACLANFEERPSAESVHRDLKAIIQKSQRSKRSRFFVATLVVFVLANLGWLFLIREPAQPLTKFRSDDGRAWVERIDAMELDEVGNLRRLGDEIRFYYHHEDAWPELKEHMAYAMALLDGKLGSRQAVEDFSFTRVRALFQSPKYVGLATPAKWYEFGDTLYDSVYLVNIRYAFDPNQGASHYAWIETEPGQGVRHTFDQFGFLFEETGSGYALFDDYTLEDLLQKLAVLLKRSLFFNTSSQTPIHGVVYFNSLEELFERVLAKYAYRAEGDSAYLVDRPLQPSYFFFSYSFLKLPQGKEMLPVVTRLLQVAGLTLRDDAQLLAGKNIVESFQGESVSWENALSHCLRPHGLRATLVGFEVMIEPFQ